MQVPNGRFTTSACSVQAKLGPVQPRYVCGDCRRGASLVVTAIAEVEPPHSPGSISWVLEDSCSRIVKVHADWTRLPFRSKGAGSLCLPTVLPYFAAYLREPTGVRI
ncbi:unnamed protein product [Symbiodinium sp. CCMP2592]|nr:unnamed protein product [Symbiodinium sp. CCMP2592]